MNDQPMNPVDTAKIPGGVSRFLSAGTMLDVVRFELTRSMTASRIAIWCVLVLFPVMIIGLLRVQITVEQIDPWGLATYFLIPEVLCLLGLLLWATPAVSTELEGQTWIHLAMRPGGRTTVLLGKYVTAVAWTFSAAVVSLTVCTILIGNAAGVSFWLVLAGLALLSCVAHGALYVLIGVLFYRRTMVAAVIYTLVVEFGLSFVPAVVNRLTINYRLRGLLAEGTDWRGVRSLAEATLGIEPMHHHLIALTLVTTTFLAAAAWRVRAAEFPTQADGGA